MKRFRNFLPTRHNFFSAPLFRAEQGQSLRIIFAALLYLAGLLHWLWFLHAAPAAWQGFDWPKELAYLSILKQALLEHQWPYFVNFSAHGVSQFMALPETILSPHILLLKFFTPTEFIVLHILFIYSVGFAFLLLMARREAMTPAAFAGLFLLVNFNGYLTAHLGVGHLMWVSCLLLPGLVYLLIRIDARQSSARHAVLLGLLMWFMLLQGSLHILVWCFMFLAIYLIFNRAKWKPVLLAVSIAAGLGLFRFLPAAYVFWDKQHFFRSGYPTVLDFLKSLTMIRSADVAHVGGQFGASGWWEYDMFIGLSAAAALFYLGVRLRFGKTPLPESLRFSNFDYPLIVFTLLAFGDIFILISKLPFPLANAERISSRFIILPFTFIAVMSALRLSALAGAWNKAGRLLIIIAGILTAGEMITHSAVWRIQSLAKIFYEKAGAPEWPVLSGITPQIIPGSDPAYLLALKAGLFLSIGALIALLAYMFLYQDDS